MKKRNNNKLFLAGIFIALVFSIGAGISFIKLRSPAETLGERVGPRGKLPSKINISDLDDDEVNSYYAGVDGLFGDDLKETLNDIIKDHHEYDYNSASDRTAYKIMDRNWDFSPASEIDLEDYDYENDNPYIRKLYADYNNDIETADRFKNEGASRVSFDKEHIWAQSLGAFGRRYGGGSDFHHLLPSDVKGNQAFHSNYNFGEPDTNTKQYLNDYDTPVGINGYVEAFTEEGLGEKVCEPLDEYKGDIARAMLYMPIRYNVHLNEDHPHLELVNGSPAARPSTTEQSGLAGDLATLLKWHVEDPVDYYEIHRNNLIYNNFQLNRNPFIDYPEWAEMIYDPNYNGPGASTAPGMSTAVGDPGVLVESITLNKTVHSMDKGHEYTLSATILPTNAEFKALSWSSSNTNVATVSNGRVSSLAYGTTTITATATDDSGRSATCEITVEAQFEKEVDRLEVVNFQKNISFGKIYPKESLTVYLYFEDESYDDVTSEVKVSLPNTHLLGEQVVNVQYSTYSATYEVFVTNDDALLSYSEEGLWYESPVAVDGVIEGWNNIGTGSYPAGDIKLEKTGNYVYKTDIWDETASQNITEMDVIVMIKYNTGGTSTENKLTVDLLNGSLGSIVATEHKVALKKTSFTEETYSFSFETPKTITGIKFTYTNKGGGNYALRYVLAKPTYQHADYLPQAEAWATYFLNKTSDQCEALEPQREEDWIILGGEFNLMHSTSKAFYTGSNNSELVLAAIDRYNAIIRAHPENEPFIAGLENVQINVLPKILNNNIIIILTIILLLSSTIISLYVLETYRKTKKYEIK
ncbi:MAG: endonuclease [Bacilli bacterium]|jgi:endonuclease I|nr:hypothetical protein [Erysipelotrichia bacterium]